MKTKLNSNYLRNKKQIKTFRSLNPLQRESHTQPKLNTISSRETSSSKPRDHRSCASLGYGRTPSHITLLIKSTDLPNLGDLHLMALSAQTTNNTHRRSTPKQTSN